MLSSSSGVSVPENMQRLTARFLLLFALAGTFLPLALQATGAPAHLCCRRADEHRCHSYALTDPTQAAIRAPGCHRDCCPAMASSHWAHPEPSRNALTANNSELNQAGPDPLPPPTAISPSRSTRAPP